MILIRCKRALAFSVRLVPKYY